MRKIKVGTHSGVFDRILKGENNSAHDYQLSTMVRFLVHEHNQMVDEISILKEVIKQQGND